MKSKNILFFIPDLNQESGGIRQYAAGLLTIISTLPREYRIYVLSNGNDPVILEIIQSSVNLELVTTYAYRASIFRKILNKIYNINVVIFNEIFKKKLTKRFYNPIAELILKLKIDIIHCPYQFIPEVKNVKLICTMHDVQELHFPSFFAPEERAHRAINYNDFIKRADVIIVSFEHVKQDILEFFQKDDDAVKVVLLKMNNLWFNKYIKAANNISNLKLSFSKYIFYPANMWPHKNHKNLVKSIKLLKEKGIVVNVVLSGDSNSKNGDIVKEMIHQYNLQNQFTLVGIVNEAELYNLYKNSQGVVIPTLYEAGSFPLVESILMEIPVICSNITSLPETIGNQEFIFDPNSVENIAKKIELLWINENYRNASILNNQKQQRRLIETNAEKMILSIYNKLV